MVANHEVFRELAIGQVFVPYERTKLMKVLPALSVPAKPEGSPSLLRARTPSALELAALTSKDTAGLVPALHSSALPCHGPLQTHWLQGWPPPVPVCREMPDAKDWGCHYAPVAWLLAGAVG